LGRLMNSHLQGIRNFHIKKGSRVEAGAVAMAGAVAYGMDEEEKEEGDEVVDAH
jgi:hypothetical protein